MVVTLQRNISLCSATNDEDGPLAINTDDDLVEQVEIRKLWSGDRSLLVEHFLRLAPHDRQMRFGGAVSDVFIADYAANAIGPQSVILGCLCDGMLRGAGELRMQIDQYPLHAEIALALEPAWQNQGFGSELLRQLITIARNRAISTLHMICLPENLRIQHLARQNAFQLQGEIDMIEGTLDPHWPNPASWMEEILHDGATFVRAIMRV